MNKSLFVLVLTLTALTYALPKEKSKKRGHFQHQNGGYNNENQFGNNDLDELSSIFNSLTNSGFGNSGGFGSGFGNRPTHDSGNGFGNSGGFGNRPSQNPGNGFGNSGGFGNRPTQNPGNGFGNSGGFGNRPSQNPGNGHGSGFGGSSGSSGCRYWCRTPQGQAYCCENVNQKPSLVVAKPGQCPPVRPSCPPTRSFGPPKTCSNDGSCSGSDKCCFDTCLQEHVCKPPHRQY